MFETIFNEGEATCLTLDPHGTMIRAVDTLDVNIHTYFSINPILYTGDRDPSQEWHNAAIPRRCDANVTCYRNILVEMDKTPLAKQMPYISEIGMPFTSAVFSGSKSIHFIISLATPLVDKKAYDEMVRRVYKAVGHSKVDKSCKNPSRLSRVPGHIRAETNKVQDLIALHGRVDNAILDAWLIAHNAPERVFEPLPPRRFTEPRDYSALSPYTRSFLEKGADPGRRHDNFRNSAIDLLKCGWDEAETYELLKKVETLLGLSIDTRIKGVISWALHTIAKEQGNGQETGR